MRDEGTNVSRETLTIARPSARNGRCGVFPAARVRNEVRYCGLCYNSEDFLDNNAIKTGALGILSVDDNQEIGEDESPGIAKKEV